MGSCIDGDARTLARVFEREPAEASHLIGQPAAALDDGGVGAPRHDHAPVEGHSARLQHVVHGPLVAVHPRVGIWAHDGVKDNLPAFGLALLGVEKVLGLVQFGTAFVVGAEEFHHPLRRHFLVRFDGEGQLVGIQGKML